MHQPGSLVTTIDPFPEYARHLATLVDLEAIGKAGLKVAVDPMFGAGSGYLENLFEQAGARWRPSTTTGTLFLAAACPN